MPNMLACMPAAGYADYIASAQGVGRIRDKVRLVGLELLNSPLVVAIVHICFSDTTV